MKKAPTVVCVIFMLPVCVVEEKEWGFSQISGLLLVRV